MSENGVYWECAKGLDNGPTATEELLRCITTTLEYREKQRMNDYKAFMLILCGCLVFFMQGGFAMLCAGCVRKKNVLNTMLKNLLDACGAAVTFFAFGYAFAYGDGGSESRKTTFIGTQNFFNMAGDNGEEVDLAVWFFQYTFSAASVTIVAGSVAGRCKMIAYIYYSIFLAGLVYPVVVHAVWSETGFLSQHNFNPMQGIGMIDFAGGGVVHLTGGTTALFAAVIIGSRRGRFYDARSGDTLDKPAPMKGNSMSLQMLGTMILWFGWYGFNAGSALLIKEEQNSGEIALHVAVNTSIAGAAGGVGVVAISYIEEKLRTGETTFDLTRTLNGVLSGLVSITACCGTIEPWAAIITGVIAAWLYLVTSSTLISYKIDDVVDAIPVHMVNGAWGLLSTGFFSSPRLLQKVVGKQEYAGLFYSLSQDHINDSYRLIFCQVIGIMCIITWVLITMVPFFLLLNHFGLLRTESVAEIVGLDLQYHGGNVDGNELSGPADPADEGLRRSILQSCDTKKLHRIMEVTEDD